MKIRTIQVRTSWVGTGHLPLGLRIFTEKHFEIAKCYCPGKRQLVRSKPSDPSLHHPYLNRLPGSRFR